MNEKLQIVTINLPEIYLDLISILIEIGIEETRSDLIRKALRKFLKPELLFSKDINRDDFKKVMTEYYRHNPELQVVRKYNPKERRLE